MAETRHTKVSLNLGVSLTLPVEHFLVGCNAGAHRHTHTPSTVFTNCGSGQGQGICCQLSANHRVKGGWCLSILGLCLGAQTDDTLASTLGFSA